MVEMDLPECEEKVLTGYMAITYSSYTYFEHKDEGLLVAWKTQR